MTAAADERNRRSATPVSPQQLRRAYGARRQYRCDGTGCTGCHSAVFALVLSVCATQSNCVDAGWSVASRQTTDPAPTLTSPKGGTPGRPGWTAARAGLPSPDLDFLGSLVGWCGPGTWRSVPRALVHRQVYQHWPTPGGLGTAVPSRPGGRRSAKSDLGAAGVDGFHRVIGDADDVIQHPRPSPVRRAQRAALPGSVCQVAVPYLVPRLDARPATYCLATGNAAAWRRSRTLCR